MNERQRYRSLLANGHLVMFYQPLLDLASGQVSKLEALARLRTEEGEILAPARFLPAFTDDDLILLFRLGLQQALEWVAQSDRIGQVFDLSFNLPPEVLALPYCAEIVNEALGKTGIAPERLYLELLETESLPLSGSVADTLRDLSELGVALVMDDLGAGHSGLNRLSEFPFRIAKLDRDLTRRIVSMGKRGIDFLDSLVRMIHALGMSCTMEGLENGQMIEAAGLVGVDQAQGYAIAHPLPPESVATWMKAHVPTPPGQPHYPLGQYARGFTRPPHLVDWDRAIAAHQSWLHEYEAALDTGNALHWRVVSRDDACMLGRWLKRVRITLSGEQPVLDAIEQAHTAFHLAAGEHARICQCDDASRSSKTHARIEVASDALLREIERFRAAELAVA
jgi:EAL domain-containing protein (putative c-di-GMP-specific phosphodiesterase class I)